MATKHGSTRGYKRDRRGLAFLYNVWNNKTDECVCAGATAPEAARAMGVKYPTFFSLVYKVQKGEIKKWTIEKISAREEEEAWTGKKER